MRIATWNVNSIKQRVPRLLPWLDERRPDVVCLQETKLADEALGSTWSYLDITALGRQEEWEDSPEGYPQDRPYAWWRRNDEYDAPGDAEAAGAMGDQVERYRSARRDAESS